MIAMLLFVLALACAHNTPQAGPEAGEEAAPASLPLQPAGAAQTVLAASAGPDSAAADSGEVVEQVRHEVQPETSTDSIEKRLDSQIERVDALIRAMEDLAHPPAEEEG